MKTYTFHVSQPGGGRVWRKIELKSDQTLEDLHFAIQDAYDWDADHLYSFFMSGRAWDASSEYSLPEDVDPWGYDFDEDDEDDEEDEELAAGDEAYEDAAEDDDLDIETSEEVAEELAALGITPDALQNALTILEDETLTDGEKLARLGPMTDALLSFAGLLSYSDLTGDVQTTTLDELELEVGKKFLYIFDYGEEHRFQLRVHAINPDAAGEADEFPRFVEAVGEAPEQYPTWDEEEEDEEEDDDAEF